MTRFEIILEVNGVRRYLETYGIENISLNYNLADVAEIDKRNSSYSKTIKVPETKNNRTIFGDISDLSVDLQTFNPNKKTKCWVLVDSIVVFDGYLQVKNVNFDLKNDISEYECVIYADNDNFFKQIGESFITDLDFSELNHYWTLENVLSSWTASWANGYYYPFIDYGYNWDFGDLTNFNEGVKVGQLFPATNVKYIFDKIFKNAGYYYESNFLNSKVFENLYIPFNREKVKRIDPTLQRFTIGLSESNYYTFPSLFQALPYTNWIWQEQQLFNGLIVPYAAAVFVGDPATNFINRIPFNNETNPEYGDPDGNYNIINHEYITPANAPSQRFVCDFKFETPFPIIADIENGPNDPPYLTTRHPNRPNEPAAYVAIKREFDPITGTYPAGGAVIPWNNGNTNLMAIDAIINPTIRRDITQSQSGVILNLVEGTLTTDLLDDSDLLHTRLQVGEKVWCEYRIAAFNDIIRFVFTENEANQNIGMTGPSIGNYLINYYTNEPAVNFPLFVESYGSRFFNVLSDYIAPPELLTYNAVVPYNLKQKDFISSLIKLFNLYIEPKKNSDNTLLIEPRDDYYQLGEIKDWTYKLDLNEPIEERILGDLQNSQITFKYKDDKDFYNEDYKNANNQITYGEKRIFIDNDFVKGDKKIEPIFSATPIIELPGVQLQRPFLLPVIAKVQNNSATFTDHNFRILTRVVPRNDESWNYYTFSSFQMPYIPDNPEFSNAATQYTKLIGTSSHSYSVGDVISITQNDGGVAIPSMPSLAEIIYIENPTNIIVNIPFVIINVGTIIGGVVQPTYGLLRAQFRFAMQYNLFQSNYYPYLGHFNNPFYPLYDLNYGETNGFYYPNGKTTRNNLFNSYWKNLIDEIDDKNSRIITASFYLTPDDISRFNFYDKIFIKDQYYRVNKIIGYDPTKSSLTRVELIKAKNIGRKSGFLQNIGIYTGLEDNQFDIVVDVERIQNNLPGSISSSSTNLVKGNSNLTIGKDNYVSDSNVMINGSGNSITGRNNIVFGNDNRIENGASEVVIFGSNQIVEESGIVKMAGAFAITPNTIQSGRDEVLYMYFDSKPVNYISASFDSVREFGSQDPVNIISGGRDRI